MTEQLELDCYHKAEEGEPKFTLLARDPLAAHLVALWAALRKGDTASAVAIFADTVSDPAYIYRNKTDSYEKVSSACDISRNMLHWRKEKELKTFGVYNVN